ncbi:hypothetical protein H2200_006969 [Cladophialophora chaetospira]|uniref:Tr-type G domain-containing protein n=1 Tax=Cladophialophora chaetospira TaxID=386627 RepID=A0AA38X9U0_9EURO|nr:hypothetical protein H2200_006969 [Cladophialophora chaetospira]
MASIFTYQDEPPRIQSPWSTPGTSTPQPLQGFSKPSIDSEDVMDKLLKLEPEHQDGPTEYKLHLLLRPRRKFVSTSTTTFISGSQHFMTPPQQPSGTSRSSTENIAEAFPSQPSTQTRQTRLQQLTTQLLWRLQQSSPFHSSSNADLVLPVLPEAAPRLGVPDRPAKLLPGLEESQGALYEIGVADDGTLIGLVEDELQESLANLNAMAASLGCTTSIIRKVEVGTCEWTETSDEPDKYHKLQDILWVAEVLVYPDSRGSTDSEVHQAGLDEPANTPGEADYPGLAEHASIEQMRVSMIGASAAGKSSLLGTLSTSTLDNSRGRSRLSLLKHRHEIASGVTSSVAHELVGYSHDRGRAKPVINYAAGDVSSWIDIHNLADRVVFLSDSPGSPRFAKSAFRSLISWKPSWTMLCIAADDAFDKSSIGVTAQTVDSHADGGTGENVEISSSYLDLCLRLHLSFVVVITKMDLANKVGLRSVLAKVLSAVKAAGRKPVILGNTPVPLPGPELEILTDRDQDEVKQLVSSMQSEPGQHSVPIVMTSAVTGLGISKLHTLLQNLPITSGLGLGQPSQSMQPGCVLTSSLFHVDEVFTIPPSRVYTFDTQTRVARHGIVLCGHVSRGSLAVGHFMQLGPFVADTDAPFTQVSQPIPRASSYGAQQVYLEGLSNGRTRSYQGEPPRTLTPRVQPTAVFLYVRIVSLRTLRLPVTKMKNGETGTIGVEPLDGGGDSIPLARARKGMVLVGTSHNATAFHSCSANFPASDFAQAQAPILILGGHAIVYVNSIRAAVKVTAVALDEDEQQMRHRGGAASHTLEEVDLFRFESDEEGEGVSSDKKSLQRASTERKEIKLSFRFVSTVEWMEVGDQILVVPTVTAAGPVTGPLPVVNTSGLSGFVGRICELFN